MFSIYITCKAPIRDGNFDSGRLMDCEENPMVPEGLILSICQVFSDNPKIEFGVSGFGESRWAVDINEDLPGLIPQVPGVVRALGASRKASLCFSGRNIRRELFFSRKKDKVEITCKDLDKNKMLPMKETADLTDMGMVLMMFFSYFVSLAMVLCPGYIRNPMFLGWLKHLRQTTDWHRILPDESEFGFGRRYDFSRLYPEGVKT